MKILISGSSGLIGQALTQHFEIKGDEVYRLVRHQNKQSDREILWYPNQQSLDCMSDLEKVGRIDVVINLSGENIANGRWSNKRKKNILESRVNSTKKICQILSSLKKPPKLLINASAVGYYGNRENEEITEESVPGDSFLANVCKEWEAATESLKNSSIRVVLLRLGAVLSLKGGALAKMLWPFKLGLGGVLGSGKQGFSVITLHDLIKIVDFIIENQKISGPVNAVIPNPVTNKEFTKALGHCLNRPTIFPVPSFAVSFIFGQMGEELLLGGAKVYPKKLMDEGFLFDYPEVDQALNQCLNTDKLS